MSVRYRARIHLRTRTTGPPCPVSPAPRGPCSPQLDGQALSSRLEQLLPLRSLVLKEDSGYTSFYHHLLKPYK